MTKTQEYYTEIQNIAKRNSCYIEYLKEMDLFLESQCLLKVNKIKSISDKIKLFWIEYVNDRLEIEYNSQDKEKNILTFLHNKINNCCLSLKSICTDEIYICIVSNKKDKINQIIDSEYNDKVKYIKVLESKIKELKKGMI